VGVAVEVAVGLAVAVGVAVEVAVGLAVAVGVAVEVAVGLAVAVGVAVVVGVTVGVAVDVPVAVAVAVGEAVGVGVIPPACNPLSLNTWSGPPATGMDVVLRVHVGTSPNPAPGFCHITPKFDCTARSVHPQAPFGTNGMLAWISTQYLPSVRTAAVGKLIVKVLPATENG
jgi:hypothetical protein